MTETTLKQLWLICNYPTTIICDRYRGMYSGALWLAFPRNYWDIPGAVDGEDEECYCFWRYYDGIVGKGATPEDAFNDLRKKMSDDNQN